MNICFHRKVDRDRDRDGDGDGDGDAVVDGDRNGDRELAMMKLAMMKLAVVRLAVVIEGVVEDVDVDVEENGPGEVHKKQDNQHVEYTGSNHTEMYDFF